MIKENLNWRTFDDDGTINQQWNLPATPTSYILDHQGIIRRKWIGKAGERSIDDALDTLIQEAQAARP